MTLLLLLREINVTCRTDKFHWIKLKSIISFVILYSYARGVGSEHFSTSAKSGQGVIDIFTTLARSKDF
jgi:hypothetical protein